jgi:ABC-type branched-subunit amino acid transport system substrate-binding protein
MRRRQWLAITAVATALAAGCSSGGSSNNAAPSPPPAVNLASDAPSSPINIGLLVSSQGEGSEVLPFANGAVVAAYRLNGLVPSGKVKLVTDDDSTDGAAAAIQRLKQQGVSGIVYASTGQHMKAGLDEANSLGIPVITPYESDPSIVTPTDNTTWMTGPSDTEVGTSLHDYVVSHQLATTADPVVVTTDPTYHQRALEALQGSITTDPLDLSGVDEAQWPATMQTYFGTGAGGHNPDAVIVWAPPKDAGSIVAAIQQGASRIPAMILPSTARVPAFERTLLTPEVDTATCGSSSAASSSSSSTSSDSSPASQASDTSSDAATSTQPTTRPNVTPQGVYVTAGPAVT